MMQLSKTPVDPGSELLLTFQEFLKQHYLMEETEKVLENNRICKVPHSKKDGYSSIYRNAANAPDKLASTNGSTEISPYFIDGVDNYYTCFELSCQTFPDKPYLGTRKPGSPTYEFLTGRQVRDLKNKFGSGLIQVVTNHKHFNDLQSEFPEFPHYNNDKPYKWVVSIFSSNRLEWAITDLACQSYNLCNTVLYDTLGPHSTQYILEVMKSPVVVCSKDHILTLINLKKKNPDTLKTLMVIISMDELPIQEEFPLFQIAANNDINLFTFNQVESLGSNFPVPLCPVGPNDLYTISFTSGTTGNPKGVVIPQKMIVAALKFCFSFFSVIPGINPFPNNKNLVPGKCLSFLPLAHIYERETFAFAMVSGIIVGFPSSPQPVESFIDDMKVLKPDYHVNVPRVLTKIESNLKESILKLGSIKSKLIMNQIKKKIEYQSSKDFANVEDCKSFWIFDSLITKKLRAAVGFDNLKTIVTGSAPISVETIKFLRALLSIGFSQGYGSTETFAGTNISFNKECQPGSSGVVGNTVEIRLRDLPSMGYTSDDSKDPEGTEITAVQKGELMVRGPQVFKYYFNGENETKKCFDEDGFFHTGDVAMLDTTGRIYIIDRVKNFFKLQQGEYVTPERIENTYLSICPMISQIFVYGDSLQPYLVGIVGLDVESLRGFLIDVNNKSKILKVTEPLEGSNRTTTINIMHTSTEALFDIINSDLEIKQKIIFKLNSFLISQDGEYKQKKSLLQGFEKLHNAKFFDTPLKLEDNTITPTMKLKRPVATKKFKEELDELYRQGSLINGVKL